MLSEFAKTYYRIPIVGPVDRRVSRGQKCIAGVNAARPAAEHDAVVNDAGRKRCAASDYTGW